MYIIVYTTCKNEKEAKKISKSLIENNLAACVSIIPSVRSIYKWNDKIEESNECLLMIKSRKYLYSDIEKNINKNHSYDLPEIITVQIDNGSPEYLEWLEKSTDTCIQF